VRLALAQYRELAAFAQFASDLDEATRKQLERGQRVTELMKQPQYSPLTIAEMGLSLYAANEGFLDDVELNKIGAFERGLHGALKSQQPELMNRINESGDFNDEIEKGLRKLIEDFKSTGTW
jgi:F-type H+/Na+-transporting ATPase subunit alpha